MTTITELDQKIRQIEIDTQKGNSDRIAKEASLKGLEAEEIQTKKLIDDNAREIKKKETELQILARKIVQAKDRLRQIVQEIPKLKTETDILKTKLEKANREKESLNSEHGRLEAEERNKKAINR